MAGSTCAHADWRYHPGRQCERKHFAHSNYGCGEPGGAGRDGDRASHCGRGGHDQFFPTFICWILRLSLSAGVMMKDVTSLSAEWLRLGMMCLSSSRHELSPAVAVIPVDPDDAYDSDPCRRELDAILDQFGYGSTDTVATTIFPYYLWNPNAPRAELFERYFRLLPRIRKLNRRGVYFERLTSYPGIKDQRGFNQLDHIISTYAHNNHRRSALQGSVIDPVQDLNNDSPVL